MTISINTFCNKLVNRSRRWVDLDLDNAKDYLSETVKEYSKYKPYLQSTSISLVDDTQDYDLPTDTIEQGIVSVTSSSYVGEDGDSIFDKSARQSGITKYFESPSLVNRDDQYVGFSNDRYGWQYEYIEIDGTKKIRLYPTPSQDDTVTIEYNSYHDNDGSSYSTIDSMDEPTLFAMAFLNVLTYEALDSGQSGSEKIELEGKIQDLEKKIRRNLFKPIVDRN